MPHAPQPHDGKATASGLIRDEKDSVTMRKYNQSGDQVFWSQVIKDPVSGCWIWQGHLQKGYGRVSYQGRGWFAHRLSYQLLWGGIPEGKTLDHLCCDRRCVYPWHLEPVTNEENTRRKTLRRRLNPTASYTASPSGSRNPSVAQRRQAWYEAWLQSFKPRFMLKHP